MVKRIEIFDKSLAVLEGVRLIGVTTGVTYYADDRVLNLHYERSLEQTIGIETAEGGEFNWGAEVTVGASTGVNILGHQAEVSLSFTGSVGKSKSWGKTEQTSTTTGRGTSMSQSFKYIGPGAALAYGYVKVYSINRNAVRCRYHVECDSGEKMTKETTIKLKSTSYGMSHFRDVVYRFNKGICDREDEDCVHALDGAKALNNIDALREQFIACFANGVGYPAIRK